MKSSIFKSILVVFSLVLAIPAIAEDTAERVESLLEVASDVSVPEESREKARDKLVALGENVIPYLIPHLDTVDILSLRVAMDVIKLIGEPAVEHLIEAMRSGNSEIAYRAASLLGEIPDKRAVGPLIEGLSSDDWRIRSACARSLGSVKAFESIGPLIEATRDPEEAVRRTAAVSLGKIGDPLAVGALVALLSDSSFMVRYPAAQALAAIGRPAVPELQKALEAENPFVQMAALEALGGIRSDASVQVVKPFLNNPDWAVRGAAVRALRRVDTVGANRALRRVKRREKHPFVIHLLNKPRQSWPQNGE